jgi:hypothetical protein
MFQPFLKNHLTPKNLMFHYFLMNLMCQMNLNFLMNHLCRLFHYFLMNLMCQMNLMFLMYHLFPQYH